LKIMRNLYYSYLLIYSANASVAKLLFSLSVIFFSTSIYAQDVTVAGLTNGISASPLAAATNDHAILGFSLAKAGGGGNSISQIVITLSQDPTNVWTDARLYRSTDGTFAGVGSETEVVTGTFGATSITFSGTPLTNWGGASGSTTENYFVVVNVHPNVSGSATMQPSLTSGNVTVNNNSVSGSSTGTNYSFTPLTTNIGSLNDGANNVAVSPLVGGSTGQAVFGFSLSSSGSQTVTALNIQFSNDPAGRYSNYTLVRSGDADFGSAGDNVTIGSLTFTPSATQVAITGLNEDVSTAKNYFLVVDVAATPTGTIQASLGSSNVTVNQGVASGSATGVNYSFLTTVIGSLNAGANNVATSPLIAGTTGKAVFGFSLASGGAQTVSEINVQLSSTPVGKLSNWSLVRSTDADFGTSGDNTTIGSLTFTPSGTQVSITGLSESITATAKNYFLVADVDPGVTGATPAIQASLGESNVVVGSGAVSGSSTGINYSFQTLITTIASLNAGANNVAASPLTAGATGKAVFGFSLISTDNQTVTIINVQLSSDPSGKLSNWSLVRSTDADFSTTGDNTVIGSLTFTPTTSQVGITGLNESITTSAKNYFLVADVNPAVTGATPAIQASLGIADVTVNAGTVSGSVNGVNYSFQTLNATIVSLNASANNVATSPLGASSTGKAVFGFSLTSTDIQTVTVINVQLSSDPSGKLSNWSLVHSTDADFASTGDNTAIGSLTFTPSATQVSITGLSESITTVAKNYFLVADVDPSVTVATPSIQASLEVSNVTVNAGSVSGSATGTNYSFAPLTATLAQLTTGIATSPLIAGTAGSTSQNAILGFSLVSNGNQTVSSIKVAFDTDPAGKFTAYGLIQSNDNSFASTGDNSNVSLSSSTVSGTGPYFLDLVPTTPIDITTIKYLFLVVSVDGGVNSTTTPATITPTLSSADVAVNQGGVTANSYSGTVYSFQASQASTIAIHSTAGTTSPINFALYSTQTATSGLTWGATPNSTSLANFRIRDGGGSADSDSQDTKVNSFTITISNPQDIETVAVFYGTSINNSNIKVGEQPVGSGTITFSVDAATLSQPLVATDGNDAYFTIRTTFKSIFATTPDNNTHVVTVTAATVDPEGSQLAAAPLTLATTGSGATINNITVAATKVIFTDAMPINAIPNSDFSATVNATDANGNRDIDHTGSVTLSVSGGPGTLTTSDAVNYPLTKSLVAGTFTWNTLQIDLAFPLYTLNGNHATFTGGNDATGTVKVQSQGAGIAKADLAACLVGSSNFFTALDSLVLVESDPADFNAGTDKTFLLLLPSGWEFLTPTTSNPTPAYSAPTISYTTSPGTDFSSAVFSGFISKTSARFTLSVSGTSNYDTLTIKGLFVKNVSATAPDSILRSGTAIIEGIDETVNLGTLIRQQGVPVDFSVIAEPGNSSVSPGQTVFAISESPVILSGHVGDTTYFYDIVSFSGNGVSLKQYTAPINDKRYVFNPSATVPDTIPITMIYKDMLNGCQSDLTKNFIVYTSAIEGIQEEMCHNDNTPYSMTVSPLFIPGGYSVDPITPFKYEDPKFVDQLTVQFPPNDLVFYLSGVPRVPSYSSGANITGVTWNPINPDTGNPYSSANNVFPFPPGTYYGYDGVCCFGFFHGPVSNLLTGYTYYFATTFIQLEIPGHGLVDGEKLYANNFLNGSSFFQNGNSLALLQPFYPYTVRVVDGNNVIINLFERYGFGPNTDGANFWGYFYVTMNVSQPYNIGTTRIDRLDTIIDLKIPNHTLSNGDQIYVDDFNGAFLTRISKQPLTVEVRDANTVRVNVKEADGAPSALIFDPNHYFKNTNWYFTGYLTFPGNYFDNTKGFPYKGAARATSLKDQFVPSNFTTDWIGNIVTVATFIVDGADRKTIGHRQKVTLLAPPVVGFSGLTSSYCSNSGAVNLTSLYADDGIYTAQPNFGIEDAINGTGLFRPADVPPEEFNNPISIIYTVTDLAGCSNSTTQITTVLSKLDPPLALDTAYCQNYGGTVVVSAQGIPGSSITWFNDPGLTQQLAITENYNTGLDTGTPTSKIYYATQKATNYCESFPAPVEVTIKTAPSANFDLPPPCVNREFTVSCDPDVANCDWNFGEGAIANGHTVSHTYTTTGIKFPTLTVTAGDGCSNSNIQQLPIVNNPIADFTFDQVCIGDITEFHAVSDSPDDSYAWDFGDGGSSPKLPDKDRMHEFVGVGDYSVTLTAISAVECTTDVNKIVPILHYLDIDKADPYILADVEGGKGYWTVEDVAGNSTWEFAQIDDTQKFVMKSDAEVWVTNPNGPYKTLDHSFLNSPCFNFSLLQRPVVSFDYIMNTTRPNVDSRDGAALEYSSDGGKIWNALGTTTSGENWYNAQGFLPGNIQVGWTSALWDEISGQIQWKSGKHKLDEIPNSSKVRLRFVFASNSDDIESDGFAFTNLKIEERNRLTLLENFTNIAYGTNNDNFKNISVSEAVKIQYHLSYPGTDDLNMANQQDPSARAAYYGIPYTPQNVPRGYIDGLSYGNFLVTDWVDAQLDKRSLSSAPYTINLTTLENTGEPNQLKIGIEVVRLVSVEGTQVLHVVVMEKDVDGNQFVVRKLLPSAAGSFLEGLDTELFEFAWEPDFPGITLDNINNLAVVVFIQDLETKEVHQAAIDLDPAYLPTAIITGLEDPTFASKIMIYPNPANQEVNVMLPEPASTQTPLVLMDAQGRVMFEGSFQAGQQKKTINTSSYAGGMYFLQITTKENVARKKVMIVHQGN
jgi:hypothetical protein